jgi:UDPglucose 6-dehydrogenase
MLNISIIGLGRLGLCVGLCLENSGYNVLGVDIVSDYIHKINTKTLISTEPSVTDMLKNSKNIRGTTNIEEALTFSDIIFIYVATPSSGSDKHYDHTMLGNVLSKINAKKVVNKHIIIGCTVIPGYIKDVGSFLLKDCINTTLSYNPEFIAQGDIVKGLFYPDFILIGEGSKEAGDILENLYNRVVKKEKLNVCRMSPSSAEITKLGVNCFVTTKIAFANMIGDLADKTEGADKFDILLAIGTDSRIGTKYMSPGYSFGGPCFPRDNRALGGYIRNMGVDPLIPEATDKSNKLHIQFQADKIYKELSDQHNFCHTIQGAGYKEPCVVPIIEESAKLKIGEILAKRGILVVVRDSKLLLDCVRLEYGNLFEYQEI